MQQLQGRTGPPRQASAPPGHRGTGHGQHRRPAHHRHLQLERVRDSSACTPIAGGCRVHLREETYAGSKGTVALLQRTHGHGRGTPDPRNLHAHPLDESTTLKLSALPRTTPVIRLRPG